MTTTKGSSSLTLEEVADCCRSRLLFLRFEEAVVKLLDVPSMGWLRLGKAPSFLRAEADVEEATTPPSGGRGGDPADPGGFEDAEVSTSCILTSSICSNDSSAVIITEESSSVSSKTPRGSGTESIVFRMPSPALPCKTTKDPGILISWGR